MRWGPGFRCGFLGLLHMDVSPGLAVGLACGTEGPPACLCWQLPCCTALQRLGGPSLRTFCKLTRPYACPPVHPWQVFRQRLEQEYGASVIVTRAHRSLPRRAAWGEERELQNPAEFPTNAKIAAGACLPAGLGSPLSVHVWGEPAWVATCVPCPRHRPESAFPRPPVSAAPAAPAAPRRAVWEPMVAATIVTPTTMWGPS